MLNFSIRNKEHPTFPQINFICKIWSYPAFGKAGYWRQVTEENANLLYTFEILKIIVQSLSYHIQNLYSIEMHSNTAHETSRNTHVRQNVHL